MVLRLPPEKLRELQELVGKWMARKSYGRQELQSLAGKLQHACKVVRPRRTFLRRVFEMISVTEKKHDHVRLNTAFRSDIAWWHTFLADWNGVTIMSGSARGGRDIEVYTDVPGGVGCGAWWSPHWLQLKWMDLKGSPTGSLEISLSPRRRFCRWCWHVLCGAVGGKKRHVVIHCNNEAAVTVLNSGYARDPQIMHLLRSLFFIKAWYQIDLAVVHIPGKAIDAISEEIIYPCCTYRYPFQTLPQQRFPAGSKICWWSVSQTGHRSTGLSCSEAIFGRTSPINPTILPVGK